MKLEDLDKARWPVPPLVVSTIWVVCCGFVDWWVNPEISLSAFYLPPVACVAWFCGRRPGTAMAVYAGAVWLTAELAGPAVFSSPLIPYWNAVIRLSFFLITALLTSEVRSRQRAEIALQEQGSVLGSILDSMGDGVLVTGIDGKVLAFNPAAKRIFGSSPLDSTLEEWLAEIEPTGHVEAANHQSISKPLKDSATGRFQGTCKLAIPHQESGGLRWLHLTAQPLLRADHDTVGAVVVVSDMTAQHEMEKRISEAIESEQRRIGQEMHDGVCQHLVGVAFAASTLQMDLDGRGLNKQADAAGEIADLVNEAIGQTRNLSHGLFPLGLDDSLAAALGALANGTRNRFGISCAFTAEGADPELDSIAAANLYRIAQESVANALRHASAKNIRISLKNRRSELELTVEDDGVGVTCSEEASAGIGRQIMKYRAGLLGGNLEIRSQPGAGTRVVCAIPMIRPILANHSLQ